MAGIGVDQMGSGADAQGNSDYLRLENLDTDVPHDPLVMTPDLALVSMGNTEAPAILTVPDVPRGASQAGTSSRHYSTVPVGRASPRHARGG